MLRLKPTNYVTVFWYNPRILLSGNSAQRILQEANVPILYSLKVSENQRFSFVSRGYKMETLARKVFTIVNW